ncbi:MAG: HNH endonuclease [Phenylobacterium sp.]|nr:MAG: HNH endonuclease [Phenylobacterium sp.]
MPGQGERWSRAELKEALRAYLQIVAWAKEAAADDFSPAQFHRDLSRGVLHPRSEGSIGRRMGNITVVLAAARQPVTGRYGSSLTHVGPGPTATLLELLDELREEAVTPSADANVAMQRASIILASGQVPKPAGNRSPAKREGAAVAIYVRDPKVVAWVLQESGGVCEACENAAPFLRPSGQPFLEVHHVRRLADDGPDVIENAIAVCPNCHRRLHHGADRVAFRRHLLKRVSRLVPA